MRRYLGRGVDGRMELWDADGAEPGDPQVVDIPDALLARFAAWLAEYDAVSELLRPYYDDAQAKADHLAAERRLAERSGLTVDQMRAEIAARLVMARSWDGALEKCSHCIPGYRHRVGNCIMCGWGPAPGGDIEGKRPLPIHELNAACANEIN